MELVQAPPLAQLSSITADFRVEDQPLAGFVQDEAKLFSTSIRPRKAGITQIPAIPFSFFDPNTEKFETVMSDPIAITVKKAETLALDAIVGNTRADRQTPIASATKATLPDFTNSNASSLLVSQTARTGLQWWWAFVFIPPVIVVGYIGDTISCCDHESIAKCSFGSPPLPEVDPTSERTESRSSMR